MKDGKPWLVFGVMGGDMQAQGHVQVLISMIDFDMNVQQAGDAARVRHSGSASPTGEPADAGGGTVYVESDIPDATVEALRTRASRAAPAPATAATRRSNSTGRAAHSTAAAIRAKTVVRSGINSRHSPNRPDRFAARLPV